MKFAMCRYIAPEQVPVKYGGLSMDADTEFSNSDRAIDISIKPSTKHIVTIPVTEVCLSSSLNTPNYNEMFKS